MSAMFRFEHPEFFWLLIPALVIVGLIYFRATLIKRDFQKWGSLSTVNRLSPRFSEKHSLKWLSVIALLILVLAAVNPQWGFRSRSIDKKTADLYIILDISNSMLAEDVAPSRLEKAKRFALDLANTFKNDRIGLVVFAGNAYMQSPLTTDWHAIQLYLNAAHPDQAGTQGTEIGRAVKLAANSRSEEEANSEGAMIVITDGEDHDEDAARDISEAVSKGWSIYIVGVGTEQGGNIPMIIDKRKDVKRDEHGQPVITKMNRPLMIDLAREGRGKYYDINEGQAIVDNLAAEFEQLERTQMEKRSFSEHKSYYQWFLLAALALIMLIPTIRFKHDVI